MTRLALAASLILTLAACGSTTSPSPDSTSPTALTTTTAGIQLEFNPRALMNWWCEDLYDHSACDVRQEFIEDMAELELPPEYRVRLNQQHSDCDLFHPTSDARRTCRRDALVRLRDEWRSSTSTTNGRLPVGAERSGGVSEWRSPTTTTSGRGAAQDDSYSPEEFAAVAKAMKGMAEIERRWAEVELQKAESYAQPNLEHSEILARNSEEMARRVELVTNSDANQDMLAAAEDWRAASRAFAAAAEILGPPAEQDE